MQQQQFFFCMFVSIHRQLRTSQCSWPGFCFTRPKNSSGCVETLPVFLRSGMRQTFVRAFLRASCEAYMRHGLSTGLRRVRAFRNTYATSTISAARELQANHGAHVGRSADFADFPDDEATQERRQALACTKVRREMSFAHAPADVRSCPEPFPATPRSASCVGIGRIGTSDTTPYVAQPCGLDDTFETIWLARMRFEACCAPCRCRSGLCGDHRSTGRPQNQ